MAYSKSPQTALRMLPYLQALRDGGEVTYRVDSRNTAWLQYKLRDALQATKLPLDGLSLSEEELAAIIELRNVADNYSIKVVGPGEVKAELKDAPKIEVVLTKVYKQTFVETAPRVDVDYIIDRWQKRPMGEEKMYFPNASLDYAKLLELHSWCEENGTIFFEDAGAVTLLPWDEETAEYAWQPGGGE